MENRSLKWVYGCSPSILKFTHSQGEVALFTTQVNAILLLEFNNRDEVKREEISELIGTEEDAVQTALKLLTFQQHPILIEDGPLIRFNQDFIPSSQVTIFEQPEELVQLRTKESMSKVK